MRKDRVIVVLFCVVYCAYFNLLPMNLPKTSEYGRGFPMKWRINTGFVPAKGDEPEKHAPEEHWKFDGVALAVNLAVSLAFMGVALAVNEIWQTCQGNRTRYSQDML